MIFDLHIHSSYSYDSILKPRKIIDVAIKKGLDGIAITDHNTIQGGLEARNINKDPNLVVIVGCEIYTDIGDIIGLFLEQEIKSRDHMGVIREIKDQGGIVVLPHPYRSHKLNPQLIENVDAIEAFNSINNESENIKASKLAEKYKKPILAGSDAHFASEIGNATSAIDGSLEIKAIKNNIFRANIQNVEYSPMCLKPASQIIKAIKTKKYNKIPQQTYNLIVSFAK